MSSLYVYNNLDYSIVSCNTFGGSIRFTKLADNKNAKLLFWMTRCDMFYKESEYDIVQIFEWQWIEMIV